MRLDRAVTRIRKRGARQALDLGILLGRRWMRPMLTLWLIAMLPLLSLSLGLTLRFGPGWALPLAFWFCQPLPEALLILWAGRALFGEKPGIRETLARFRKTLGFGVCLKLLFYRLHPLRPLAYAILMLEEPEPGESGARLAMLSRGGDSGGFFPLLALLMTLLLWAGALFVVIGLIPDELEWAASELFGDNAHLWLLASYILVAALLAPIWTCCGFMLYISRRVELEGWDLELGFRGLNARLRGEGRKTTTERAKRAATVLALPAALLLAFAPPAFPADKPAAPPATPAEARELARSVREKPTPRLTRTEYRWVRREKPKKEEKKKDDPDFWERLIKWLDDKDWTILKVLAEMAAVWGKYLVLALVGLGLAGAALHAWRTGKWGIFVNESPPDAAPAPRVLFGLDLRPETLPASPADEARRLFAEGRARAALSLLYRAALSRLVNDLRLPLDAAMTEQECERAARNATQGADPGYGAYFSGLTAAWTLAAYGHRNPDAARFAELARGFREAFP